MAEVRITCIIPTIGRDTLPAALASCAEADEILVVVDDAKAGAWQPGRLAANVRVLHVPECNRGGHSSRNHAMPHATGTHLCFLDDDDVYLSGAIEAMRAAACDRPVIFKMDHPQHGILWRTPELYFGNVSTQMFLVPNDPERLGVWEHHAPELPQPGGDFTFIKGCVEKMGEPVWREEIVAKYDAAMTTISIVTPWLDHLELREDYLDAVMFRSPRDELLVIDNGSMPRIGLPGIRAGKNLGFAEASNCGLYAAQSDVVLFLNNDIRATHRDWLEQIRAALEPGVLVGAELCCRPHGNVDSVPLPYLSGWCIAGMTADLRELGGFDEEFREPSYYGDNDLCFRARAAGMTLREVRVGLVHKKNVTAGPSTDPAVAAATVANRERFAAKVRRALAEDLVAV